MSTGGNCLITRLHLARTLVYAFRWGLLLRQSWNRRDGALNAGGAVFCGAFCRWFRSIRRPACARPLNAGRTPRPARFRHERRIVINSYKADAAGSADGGFVSDVARDQMRNLNGVAENSGIRLDANKLAPKANLVPFNNSRLRKRPRAIFNVNWIFPGLVSSRRN